MDPLQAQQGSPAKMPKMATPEQKQELMDLIENTKGKLGEFNSTSFAVDNQIKEDTSETLKQIFSILQSAGVDLTDPKSVSDFLTQLRSQNPQMSQLFEQALNQLLGEEQQGIPPPSDGQTQMEAPGGIPPMM